MSDASKDKLFTPGINRQVERLIELAVVTSAAALARRGEYEHAESMLLPLTKGPEHNGYALDLLAKISAQQGKYGEAIALWKRALVGDPLNRKYNAAIEDCNMLQDKVAHGSGQAPLSNIIIAINVTVTIALLIVVAIFLSLR
jgi:predicted Zn-dependent protease